MENKKKSIRASVTLKGTPHASILEHEAQIATDVLFNNALEQAIVADRDNVKVKYETFTRITIQVPILSDNRKRSDSIKITKNGNTFDIV